CLPSTSLHCALPISLSMLLHRYGEVLGRVWALVRRGSATSAQARFGERVVRSEPFQPLRDHRGGEAAEALVRERCRVLEGDFTEDRKRTRLKSSHVL